MIDGPPARRIATSSTAWTPRTCGRATSGKDVLTDFLAEVQVKSSGYNAENRAATGGVISADHEEREQPVPRRDRCLLRAERLVRRPPRSPASQSHEPDVAGRPSRRATNEYDEGRARHVARRTGIPRSSVVLRGVHPADLRAGPDGDLHAEWADQHSRQPDTRSQPELEHDRAGHEQPPLPRERHQRDCSWRVSLPGKEPDGTSTANPAPEPIANGFVQQSLQRRAGLGRAPTDLRERHRRLSQIRRPDGRW